MLEVWKSASLITTASEQLREQVMTRRAARVRKATHALPHAQDALTEPPEGDTHAAMNRKIRGL